VNVSTRRGASERKVNRKDAPMLGTFELAAATKSSGGFNPSTLILILIVVVAFYLLMIRPQQRRKQQAAQKQDSVQPGARVRTTAGMYATVVDVDGDDVILEVAPGIEVRYMKRAVMDVVSPGEEPEEEDETLADEAEVEEPEETVEDDVPEHVEADDETVADATAEAPETSETAEATESDESPYEQATGTKKD
jgi:preprotein translocase YajC subunit